MSKANSERASRRSWPGVRLTRVEQLAMEKYPPDGTSEPFGVLGSAFLAGWKACEADRKKRVKK